MQHRLIDAKRLSVSSISSRSFSCNKYKQLVCRSVQLRNSKSPLDTQIIEKTKKKKIRHHKLFFKQIRLRLTQVPFKCLWFNMKEFFLSYDFFASLIEVYEKHIMCHYLFHSFLTLLLTCAVFCVDTSTMYSSQSRQNISLLTIINLSRTLKCSGNHSDELLALKSSKSLNSLTYKQIC